MNKEINKYKDLLLDKKIPLPPLYTENLIIIEDPKISKNICLFATKYVGNNLYDELTNQKYYDNEGDLFFKFLYEFEQFLNYVYNLGYWQIDCSPLNYLISDYNEFYFIDAPGIIPITDNLDEINKQIILIFFMVITPRYIK